MSVSLEESIRRHSFFRDMGVGDVSSIAVHAKHLTFDADRFIFREGEDADALYLITHGRVSLELSTAHRGRIIIQTIEEDDVLGISWLSPPYKWHFDARALTLTRLIMIDAAQIRKRCEEDNAFGYRMMSRLVGIIMRRLQAVRLQLLEMEEM
ncbi:MAG: cyclic nucleotide-binding domain-containing protein [Candidatus Nitrosocaldus sp.]|nr:cyclic nucleotide-binding domain-containing protein [Candidatus Nitrosocaldus sp.]MDW8276333.1 cyclic nucleotide-binding domain-containing protein [Candidatus Nitrosocaldus sp.]